MSLLSRLFTKSVPQKVEAPVTSPAAAIEPIQAPARPARPDDEQILNKAIASGDHAAIVRLVTEASSTRVRQQAAQAVEDPVSIKRLVKDTRGGKDKSVYRILRQKADLLLAAEREVQETEQAIEARIASLERHSKRHFDELFAPTLDAYEIEWKALEARATDRDIARALHAIARGREVIAQQREKLAAREAEQAAAALAAAQAEQERAQREQAQAALAAAAAAERDAAAAQQEAVALAMAEQQAAEDHVVNQLGSLIRKAGAALRDGSTARAAGLRRAIQEKIEGIPSLPAHLVSQLQQLDAKLQELKDWKEHAAAPKRAQLIEAMKALVGTEDDPEELAVEIRRLQAEWKTLSKGVAADTESDWQQFHQAAQAAYEPCRLHFESLANQRQQNLERRQALVARLGAFESGHDWEHPDWPLVARALRESRQEWRSHSPVERSAGKAVQEEFEAIAQRLHERLQAEYARNVSDKRSLIARAQQALASDDVRKAIDDVKHLQQRWKSAGIVPREDSEKLWDEFRQVCDAVFQKRQQEHQQYVAGLEESKAKALVLCEEAEAVAALTGDELTEGFKKLPDMKEAFSSLGELPRAEARNLYRRFERAIEQCDAAMASARAEKARRSWQHLIDAADAVRAWRLAVAEGRGPEEADALKQAAEEFVANVPQWPKGGLQAIKAVLARSGVDDTGANEMALRTLCIRAEILTGQPTPPADQGARREYQMQRLLAGMGQGGGNHADSLEKLMLEWVSVGASRQEVFQELRDRLAKCQS